MDRPDRFSKAVSSGADVVIIDLEDAVAADRKEEGREHADRWLDGRPTAILRINGADTRWHDDDIAMAAGHPGTMSAVMVPKADLILRLNSALNTTSAVHSTMHARRSPSLLPPRDVPRRSTESPQTSPITRTSSMTIAAPWIAGAMMWRWSSPSISSRPPHAPGRELRRRAARPDRAARLWSEALHRQLS